MSKSPQTTWQRMWTGLRRDRAQPLGKILRNGARYAAGLATAPLYLRDCDRVGVRAQTRGAPLVDNRGRIEIGDDLLVNCAFARVSLSSGPRGTIRIGDDARFNFGVTISAEDRIEIGDRVRFGPHVTVADHDDALGQTGVPAPIAIGDDVWLASRVQVKKGVRVGAGTVVVAGSVVADDLPPGVIAGGVPARVLHRRGGAKLSSDEAPLPHGRGAASASPGEATCGILIADFSVQELARHLAQADPLGPCVRAVTAPFGQVVQSLHGLALLAAEHGAEFALVWTRPEAAVPAFCARLEGRRVTTVEVLTEVDAFAARLVEGCRAVRAAFAPTWVLPPFQRGLGMADMKRDGIASTLMQMNLRLAERLEGSHVHVLEAQRWLSAAGPKAVAPRLYYMGKIGFSSEVLAEAARDVRAALRGLAGQAKKLLVLDLDDTLWGGVVGDVGWQNLRLGGHDALGEAYSDLQRHLKALTRRGVALAVVSKNEETVALEAIKRHPEMVLGLEDLSAYRIDWRDKATNIVEIARELNLGLQSVVFIDDNPVERARVREALPEVFVPEWPDDKTQSVPALLGLRCFDAPSTSREDLERTRMYAEERARVELRAHVESLDEWLLRLDTRVRFEPLGPGNLPRAAQLLNKTNQMNLRTRRMGEAELLAWARAPGHEVWAAHVSDRLGDAGLTGLVGLELAGDTATLVDHLLSCRVMGRKVEETLVWAAVERAKRAGATRLEAPFSPTEKNKPALAFWKTSGLSHDEASGVFTWDLRAGYPLPSSISVEGLDDDPPAARRGSPTLGQQEVHHA